MNTEESVNENSPLIARRKVIQSLPFLAAGGLMALLSSCTPNRNTARRTGRRTSRRVSRRHN